MLKVDPNTPAPDRRDHAAPEQGTHEVALTAQRRTGALLVVGVLLLAAGDSTVRADTKAPGSYYPQQPKPAAALEPLKALTGTWSCHGVLAAGAIVPGAPEAKYRSSIKVAALYDGFAYSFSYEQTFSDKNAMPFAGTWYVAWDDIQKALVYFWIDKMGTVGHGASQGWQGNTLVLTGEGSVVAPTPDGVSQSKHTLLRDTFTRDSAENLHWKGELKIDGAPDWVVIGDDHCKKN